MASLCDICARPGTCCRGFALSAGVLHDGPDASVDEALAHAVTCTRTDGSGSFLFGLGPDALAAAKADSRLANVALGLPFRRHHRDETGRWRYMCDNLGANGRCTDYANRPAPCHALTPGASKPCGHHITGIGMCTERFVDYGNNIGPR